MRSLLVFLTALMLCYAACAAELFGTVDALSGSAFVSEQSGKSAVASVGQQIYQGQTISSGPDGEVHIVTEDGGIIALRPDSVFRVDEYKAEGGSADKIFMSLLKGAVRSITGWIGKHDPSAYLITTPTATLGIRGTDHEVTVVDKGDGDEPGTYDTVNEGSTVLKTPQGEAEVTPGKFAFAPRGRAMAPVILAQRPRFWAMRKLKIEERIPQRKESLRGRIEQMRDERIKQMKTIRAEWPEQVREQRGDLRQQEREPVTGRRNELRENRLKQARQHREARRMQAEHRREEKMGEPHREQRGKMMQKDSGAEEGKRRNPEHRHGVKRES